MFSSTSPCSVGASTLLEGTPDEAMLRQSAFFSDAVLHREVQLGARQGPTTRQAKAQEDEFALGGMRRPDKSVLQSPLYAKVGQRLREMLERFVERHPHSFLVVNSLRQGHQVDGFLAVLMQEFRTRWMAVLGSDAPREAAGPDAATLEAWGAQCGDGDARDILPRWLREGAPLGIEHEIETCGVFPASDGGERSRSPVSLYTELSGWANYRSAEEEPDVVSSLL